MAVSVVAEALVRWQHAAGPFWPYVCAAPFLASGSVAGTQRQIRRQGWTRRERTLAEALAGNPLPPAAARRDYPSTRRRAQDLRRHHPPCAGEGSAGRLLPSPAHGAVGMKGPHGRLDGAGGRGSFSILLVDLPPEPVLAVAPLLVEQGWYVVPVVQRWIASPAVLPCRRLMETLLQGAWQARQPKVPRGAVLVADGARAGPAGYPLQVPGRAFDNRYEYQICRFPSLDFLEAQGVRRGRWITTGAGGIVSPDLAPYLEELLRAGIEIDVVPWSRPA